ncbi:reverse transcriptase-like protein [Sporosarcina pasteurii]|uniref:RNase H n=1 Tax=Sporosarcina pasteurii TaxID=1474 RepID=A0A380BY30_SPOPA|nr:reverse transcriptase-like protein [Sporosarcina pasteurii]MDS9471389.1 reverse transcriptase-like protein [Sporosarcina pasteurii]QBQ04983.1 reverse transcriptase-like protein [Sporosarcina pasteurii]SUJ08625.1 RNase H [Sporosarcina pasteurii]
MKVRIEWIYSKSKSAEITFHSEEIEASQAVGIAEDLVRTGRTKSVVFVDQFDSKWTIKEMKGYLKGIETEPHNIIVYFDGGYDRPTNSAGLGCVIYYDQNGKSYRLRKNAFVEHLKSNNEAEYAALYMAVQELAYLNVHHLPVRIIGDSRVVINHLTEEWPAIEKDLSDWADKIEAKMEELSIYPDYYLVNRNANKEADRLATQALEGIEIEATIEVVT